MRITSSIALALAAAGCLSKPDRPSGIDGPVAQPDAGVPDVIFRRDAEVAKLNNDAYDDLVRWGNLTGGQDARVWIYFGGPSGLPVTPDLALDVTFDTAAAWHEVIDVRVEDFDPTPLPELLVLVAEDDQHPTVTNDPVGRNVHLQTWSPVTTGTAAPVARSAKVQDARLGGLILDPYPAYALARETVAGGTEMIFGGLDANWRLDVTGQTLGAPEPVSFVDGGGLPVPLLQELFDTPGPSPDDNLLGVSQGAAWSSEGDAMPDVYNGMLNGFREGKLERSARAAAGSDPLVIASGGATSAVIQVCRAAPGSTPEVYELTLDLPEPTDYVIGEVDGPGLLDVVKLDQGKLVLYQDLVLDSSGAVHMAIPGMTIDGPDDLAGYDLLVIGNFSDASGDNEIYVLGPPPLVPRCLVLSGGALIGC